MRCAVFVATVLCLLTSRAEATSIVAVRTATTIVLGGDSKISRGDHSETWVRCKIESANNVFWGEEGILEVPEKNFSVRDIAEAAMSAGGSLSARILAFENAVVPRLIQILNELRVGEPDWYRQNEEDQSAVEIVFVAFEDGIPHLHLRYFHAKSDPILGTVSIQVGRKDCPSPYCTGTVFAALGLHEIVDSKISKNPSIWRTLGLQGAVHNLIEAQIEADPGAVGPPIAIVEITKEGPHWVSDGVCTSH